MKEIYSLNLELTKHIEKIDECSKEIVYLIKGINLHIKKIG